jgi:DNA-binding NarL/FixJ family response regulator
MNRDGIETRNLRALIIDESHVTRSSIATILRGYGIDNIRQVSRPSEAYRLMGGSAKDSAFDVIICEHHFTTRMGVPVTGHDFLDDLRRSRGLPMSVAFIMASSERRYQYVADSVEGGLDDYLLKPFAPAALEERLDLALRRKQALRPVFDAIEREDFDAAAQLCELIFEGNGPYALYAARIGSELYLRLARYTDANRLLDAVLRAKALPWARLGIAQVQLSGANPKTACRSLEVLINEHPGFVDAYDTFARALLEDLRFDEAIAVYDRAVKLTPGNVRRLQKLGSLLLFNGDSKAAVPFLTSAATLGASSRALDFPTLFQLALAHYDLGTAKGTHRSLKYLHGARKRIAGSMRLDVFTSLTEIVECLENHRIGAAVERLQAMNSFIMEPRFDFEMASSFLQLLDRLLSIEVHLEKAPTWVRSIGERFCVSRTSTRLLELATRRTPELAQVIRDAFERVSEMTRKAMVNAVAQEHELVVRELLAAGKATLNAKLGTLARAALDKHGRHLGEELRRQLDTDVNTFLHDYAGYGTHANPAVKLGPKLR